MSIPFYKNIEISREFGVSHPTVTEWIKAAQENKNSLQYKEINNKIRVLRNGNNFAVLQTLSYKSRKFKNQLYTKKVKPTQDFYKIFTEEEVIELISDLQLRQVQKYKFTYLKAEYWNKYYDNFNPENTSISNELLITQIDIIKKHVIGYKNLVITDLGCGNGKQNYTIINSFKENFNFNRYIAVDISPELLDQCEENISRLDPNIQITKSVVDFETHNLSLDIFRQRSWSEKNSNLILCIGSTISNLEDRLQFFKNVRKLMLESDLFAFNFTFDSGIVQGDLVSVADTDGILDDDAWPLRYLGVDLDKCSTEVIFEKEKGFKNKLLTLDTDYEISFDLFGKKEVLNLSKEKKISVWKSHLLNFDKIINELRMADLDAFSILKDPSSKVGFVICKAGAGQ